MAEALKKCFRCGQILPLSMFYAHPMKGTKEMLDTKEKHFRFIIKNFPLATIHF